MDPTLFPMPGRRPLPASEAEARKRASKREYTRREIAARKEAGFIRKTVWIPAEDESRFSRYVRRLQKECSREMPGGAKGDE